MIRVDLSPAEMDEAEKFARAVCAAHKAAGTKRISQNDHLESALTGFPAEAAVSKALRLPWLNIPTSEWLRRGVRGRRRLADVGHDIEARATRYSTGHLLVYDDDPPDRRCVLVTVGHLPRATLVGWIYAADGRMVGDLRVLKSNPAYWVPRQCLRPAEELLALKPKAKG